MIPPSFRTLLVQSRDVDRAEKIFSTIDDKTIFMYGAMFKGLSLALEECVQDEFTFSGYISNDMSQKVLQLFDQMSVKPNEVIFTLLFNACAKLADANAAKIGTDALKQLPGAYLDDGILVNSAIDMLMKSGDVAEAERLFSTMTKPSVYTYGALMKGYTLNDEPTKCLQLFDEIQRQKVILDEPIYVSLVGACSQIGILSRCRRVVDHIPLNMQNGLRMKTALIDMWVSDFLVHPCS